jgi:hypothetical protein
MNVVMEAESLDGTPMLSPQVKIASNDMLLSNISSLAKLSEVMPEGGLSAVALTCISANTPTLDVPIPEPNVIVPQNPKVLK